MIRSILRISLTGSRVSKIKDVENLDEQYCPEVSEQCNTIALGPENYICQRQNGHDGPHVAYSVPSNKALAIWEGGRVAPRHKTDINQERWFICFIKDRDGVVSCRVVTGKIFLSEENAQAALAKMEQEWATAIRRGYRSKADRERFSEFHRILYAPTGKTAHEVIATAGMRHAGMDRNDW